MVPDLDILYVDDEPRMIHLVAEAFAESPIRTQVHGVESCREARAFLAGEGEHSDAPTPDLILLDKDLGGESGLDALVDLAGQTASAPPVVLFTSSGDPTDVELAYDRGASAFVQKPGDFDGLVSFARGAATFWGPAPAVAST